MAPTPKLAERGTTKIENLKRTLNLAVSWILNSISKKASGDTIGLITDERWTIIKAVDENLSDSRDKTLFASLNKDSILYLT